MHTIDSFEAALADREFWRRYQRSLAVLLTPLLFRVARVGAGTGARLAKQPIQKAAAPARHLLIEGDLNTIAEDAIRGYVPELSANLTQTTYESLRNIIVTARAEGHPVDWVIERAQLLFSAQRAQMIAVTEVTRLFSIGAIATYEAIGLDEWQWQTVRDPWVCEICAPKNGTRHPIGGDGPPAHPRCRCLAKPVVPETP